MLCRLPSLNSTAGTLATRLLCYSHLTGARLHPASTPVLEYYEYLYTSTQSMADLRLYQDLPPALAMRLAISVHRRILVRCPALYSLSDDALLGMLGRLKPRICECSRLPLHSCPLACRCQPCHGQRSGISCLAYPLVPHLPFVPRLPSRASPALRASPAPRARRSSLAPCAPPCALRRRTQPGDHPRGSGPRRHPFCQKGQSAPADGHRHLGRGGRARRLPVRQLWALALV